MVITPVVDEEVQSIIKSLKDSSAGWDIISARVVKTTYSSCITPLTHILNISLLNGVFPSELKIARVIPPFKYGEPSNFPTIDLFQCCSFSQKSWSAWCTVACYLLSISTIYCALIILVDRISKALENDDFVLGIFLDFSNAFDTINHSILYKNYNSMA